MSNLKGILILIALGLNVTATHVFEWHFNKSPLKQDILLSPGFEKSFPIYVPMAQTYDVDIDFSRDNKSFEYLQRTLGPMTQPNEKGLPFELYWEIADGTNIVKSKTVLSEDSCAWADDYVSRCFGRFQLPAGNYLFRLKVLELSPELTEFDTTLSISYNFKSAHTWQTSYIFGGMLFNIFIAPIIAGIIAIVFIIRGYRHITRDYGVNS